MEWKHIFIVAILAAVRKSESADAMNVLASGFVSVMEECTKELNLGEGLISDLYSFHKLDFTQLHRETGCAIICMSNKLDLLADDGKLHHGKTREYALKHGANDDIATKIITIFHSCEVKNEGIEDDCGKALEVAKCFRVGIHEVHWDHKGMSPLLHYSRRFN